ncbi:hypothetical protein E2C01_025750 [Portunus trituberculatus]|uniref:Uncharacterized protein n=1 Tax=Portunus trituberculatus TaxID=210409 RepID=A0A5B7EGS2_PORTR|nr:hypothetical protein [Portunus trituberculatus]
MNDQSGPEYICQPASETLPNIAFFALISKSSAGERLSIPTDEYCCFTGKTPSIISPRGHPIDKLREAEIHPADADNSECLACGGDGAVGGRLSRPVVLQVARKNLSTKVTIIMKVTEKSFPEQQLHNFHLTQT